MRSFINHSYAQARLLQEVQEVGAEEEEEAIKWQFIVSARKQPQMARKKILRIPSATRPQHQHKSEHEKRILPL